MDHNGKTDSMHFDELQLLLETLNRVYGYDFTGYATASIQRRCLHFMSTRKIGSIGALQSRLIADEQLFEDFVQTISVTVTEMFRDPAFYQSLRRHVASRLATYPFIKVWVAGCATGEEVYSLAIMLKEEGLLARTLIYATDINQHSLEIARKGIFPLEYMKTYTQNYQKAGGKEAFSEYYVANYDLALFDPSLREKIVFSWHNLATDQSFNEFQLILCRNVLIYFAQSLQNKVINLFYDSLCPFGFLALGSKESLMFTDRRHAFDVVDKKEKIYLKTQ